MSPNPIIRERPIGALVYKKHLVSPLWDQRLKHSSLFGIKESLVQAALYYYNPLLK
jgi:hypothetical protein